MHKKKRRKSHSSADTLTTLNRELIKCNNKALRCFRFLHVHRFYVLLFVGSRKFTLQTKLPNIEENHLFTVFIQVTLTQVFTGFRNSLSHMACNWFQSWLNSSEKKENSRLYLPYWACSGCVTQVFVIKEKPPISEWNFINSVVVSLHLKAKQKLLHESCKFCAFEACRLYNISRYFIAIYFGI